MKHIIKLKPHVTIKQLKCLFKKGIMIRQVGFNFYGMTDNDLLANVINEVNKNEQE